MGGWGGWRGDGVGDGGSKDGGSKSVCKQGCWDFVWRGRRRNTHLRTGVFCMAQMGWLAGGTRERERGRESRKQIKRRGRNNDVDQNAHSLMPSTDRSLAEQLLPVCYVGCFGYEGPIKSAIVNASLPVSLPSAVSLARNPARLFE